jgi:hypothetical protein
METSEAHARGDWCGHCQEFIPVPDEGDWVRLVPIIGTAT